MRFAKNVHVVHGHNYIGRNHCLFFDCAELISLVGRRIRGFLFFRFATTLGLRLAAGFAGSSAGLSGFIICLGCLGSFASAGASVSSLVLFRCIGWLLLVCASIEVSKKIFDLLDFVFRFRWWLLRTNVLEGNQRQRKRQRQHAKHENAKSRIDHSDARMEVAEKICSFCNASDKKTVGLVIGHRE